MTTPRPQATPALDQPLSTLAGVGPAAQAKLAQLGLYGVRDLLWYFPNRYEDFSNRVSVVDIIEGQLVTVLVKVVDFKTRPARQIGRASCRGRGEIWVVAVSVKK